MDAGFWQGRWERNEIGFHEGAANTLLVKHVDKLSLAPGSRIFLPLCGKTRDIAWLLSRGYRVAGAELSERAVGQLFDELGVQPVVSRVGELAHYGAEGLDVFQGDIFVLSHDVLGTVDAVYDRAALVALPPETRPGYAAHVTNVSLGVKQLVIGLEYDQTRMDGPPFSVTEAEVRRLYRPRYTIATLETREVAGGLKGVPATETMWLLTAG